jgi:hypothetical protein
MIGKDCMEDKTIGEMISTQQYYLNLNKNKGINILITKFSSGELYFSIYDNRSEIESDCSIEQLKGLADFLYDTIGEN